jgi:hypothetical protein
MGYLPSGTRCSKARTGPLGLDEHRHVQGTGHRIGVGDVGECLDSIDDPRSGPYEGGIGVDRPYRNVPRELT